MTLQKNEGITELHCMFCGWYRRKDTSKVNSQPWVVTEIVNNLLDHYGTVHFTRFHQFLGFTQAYLERHNI